MLSLRGIPLRRTFPSSLSSLRTISTIPTTNATPPPPPFTSTTTSPPLNRPKVKAPKAVGDISSLFPSLSGKQSAPLEPRFAQLKERLLFQYRGSLSEEAHHAALQDSWDRLIRETEQEVGVIRREGNKVIPQIDFRDLPTASTDPSLLAAIKKRGSVIIKNVLPASEALDMKAQAQSYIRQNQPHVKAFPADNPSVYEIYWSPPQIRARSHPNLHRAHLFLLSSLWAAPHPSSNSSVSLTNPLTYADRLRIRTPGDAQFALGPHIDGGSLERWEDPAYAQIYSEIFSGNWEQYDPFANVDLRDKADMDLYNGAGSCEMFRAWQGWLSLSHTGPNEGTLLVNPLLKLSTAYTILRPFFSPPNSPTNTNPSPLLSNWKLTLPPTPHFPNSTPAAAQELSPLTHPHLSLPTSMIPVPPVNPGDCVAWHCDTIHAVDKQHIGKNDSSVFYIPACPESLKNLEFLGRQRVAFEGGRVPPDFPGAGVEGVGEAGFVGRGKWEHVVGDEGRRAMGWKG